MIDLSVKYLGLTLKNPIVVGSCGLTGTVDGIKKLEESGAGAIVLRSLFEEQILINQLEMLSKDESINNYPEAIDYIRNYAKTENIDKYLNLISESKKIVKIPIIASINCNTAGEWIDFATKIEHAGADALELNVFVLPSDIGKSGEENEKIYFDVIEKVRKVVKLPISLKISYYSASLGQLVQKISWTKKVDGIVMFNRSYSSDIDIDDMKIIPSSITSSPSDISISLRWVAIMRDKISIDIAASTGVHDGDGVIKQILAGANAVQIVSSIYKNGTEVIFEILSRMEQWMTEKGFSNISDFRGKLSQGTSSNLAEFERVQFMKYFSNIQ